MNLFKEKFNSSSSSKVIIGQFHLAPLLGYPKYPGLENTLENALKDMQALESGGVDGLMFENNYDYPHKIEVDTPVAVCLTLIAAKLRAATKLPLGINVLWNDYRTALAIAKLTDLDFVRVPVFVDEVQTDYGRVKGDPADVMKVKNQFGANRVAILTDIHVKHAKLLSSNSLVDSAREAIACGSDGLIVTGKWTGDPPKADELEQLRRVIDDFPLLIGSGLDPDNANQLMKAVDGAIVGTSLKRGSAKPEEVNVKAYTQRVDTSKVRQLMGTLHN